MITDLSVVVLSLMIYNLAVYYNTADDVSDGVRLWPTSVKIWPTYVALAVAIVSTKLAIATLIAYGWGTAFANRWNFARTVLGISVLIFNVIIWAVAAYSLKGTSVFHGIGPRSLWSSSCRASAQQHQLFGGTVNLRRICLTQVFKNFSRR